MPTKSVSFGGVFTCSEDKPKEKRGFNCGSLRSSLRLMGVNGTLIAVGLVGSKLRKREEAVNNNTTSNNNNNNSVGEPEQVVVSSLPQPALEPPPFLWAYHNSATHLCNSSQDTLVSGNGVCEEGPECKGLKKNLRGKLKKLVTKKPPQEVYTIPAELRPQLKQIYVY